MTNFNKLHADLLLTANALAEQFANAGIPQFTVTVQISREYPDSAIEVKYSAGKRWESNVTGNYLQPVVDEVIRRYGWDIANNTKLLE